MQLNLTDILLTGLLWIFVAVYLSMRMKTGQSRIAEHLQQMVNPDTTIQTEVIDKDDKARAQWLTMLIDLGNSIPLFNAQQRGDMGKLLIHAGWRMPIAVPVLIASKLIAGASLALISLMIPLPEEYRSFTMQSLVFLAAFVLGMILTEYYVKGKARQRQTRIESSLPDALDLLVICTNAGYSLVASLQRTARELKLVCPPLGDELEVTCSELQLSGDTTAALRNLAERIGTISIRSLVVTLVQSQQYGTPITQSLRQLSRSERTRRTTLLEEKAAKLSTKITIPMMLFILPGVMIITAGPAIMNLLSAMKNG